MATNTFSSLPDHYGTGAVKNWENAFIGHNAFNGQLELAGTVEDGSSNPLERRVTLLTPELRVLASINSSPIDGSYSFENLRIDGPHETYTLIKQRLDGAAGYAQVRDLLVPV